MKNIPVKMRRGEGEVALFFCLVLIVIGAIVALMFSLPKYNVWRSELQGRAEFVRAEQNRQIKIEEAKANLEAEKLNAEAEVERAKGAARAIEIENGKLTDTYIKYLAVRQFNTDNAKFIYIPAECGVVPVMESTRLIQQK
jgi:predicted Holliday junction resolvase-like endonuclease